MNVIAFPAEPYRARVFSTARWLKGHAGRAEHVFAKNLRAEGARFQAAMEAQGTPPEAASALADRFMADVLKRIAWIDHAATTQPAAELVDLPGIAADLEQHFRSDFTAHDVLKILAGRTA